MDASYVVPRSHREILTGVLLTAISPLAAQTGRVRIVVIDQWKATIAKATIELLGKDDKLVRTQGADERGVSRWAGLPMGDARFRILATGYKVKVTTLTIKNSDELPLEVVLEVGQYDEAPPQDSAPLLRMEGR